MSKYFKPYLVLIIFASFCMTIEVVMDLLQPQFMKEILDNCIEKSNADILFKSAFYMFGIAFLGCICGSLNNFLAQYTSHMIANKIRTDTFSKILSLSTAQLRHLTTGSLITRITLDISNIQLVLAQMMRGAVRTFVMLIGSIYFMFYLDFYFGLLIIILLPVIVCALAFCIYKAPFKDMQIQLDKLNSILQDDLSGIRVIKAFVQEVREFEYLKKTNSVLVKLQYKILFLIALMDPILNLIIATAISLILAYCFKQDISASYAMAAISYILQLINSILMVIMLFQIFMRGFTSLRRIIEILMLPLNIELNKADLSENIETISTKGELEFKNVSFSYPSQSPILNHFNLKIKNGTTVLILGETASGKSTLVNLISRFYDVTQGEILLNGIDIKNYPIEKLRNKISIHKTELFSKTVEYNINFSSNKLNEELMEKAAKIAQADSFISALPAQYQTILTERGHNLSGGQQQRLALARAILKPCEILILDNATNALDSMTKNLFYESLKTLKCTKIIIAEHLMPEADCIIVMSKHEIKVGTHRSLLKESKLYQEMYKLQTSLE